MSGVMAPTYQSGFASPQRGRLKYPGLWRGCVGAWNPGLGQTGLVLRDHSGYNNHGTLTNMDPATDWVASDIGGALEFDASDDTVTHGGQLPASGPWSVVAWFNLASFYATYIGLLSLKTSGNPFIIGLNTDNASYRPIWFGCAGSLPLARCRFSTDFSAELVARNTCLVITNTGGGDQSSTVNYKGYINGIEYALVTPGSFAVGTNASVIGRASNVNSHFSGKIHELRIYNRILSTAEAKSFATRPGIAYELAPRRRASIQVPGFKAAWLNQRSQIIGGGVK